MLSYVLLLMIHNIFLQIKQSKTDQQRQGVTLYTAHSNHFVCAVCAMKTNLAIHHCHGTVNKASTPFFSFPLTRNDLISLVLQLLHLIGLDPFQYSVASLAGLSDYEIKLLGQWNSDCYQLYINSPLNLFLGIPLKIVRTQTIKFQYAIPYILNKDSSEQSQSQSLL